MEVHDTLARGLRQRDHRPSHLSQLPLTDPGAHRPRIWHDETLQARYPEHSSPLHCETEGWSQAFKCEVHSRSLALRLGEGPRATSDTSQPGSKRSSPKDKARRDHTARCRADTCASGSC